MSGGAEVPAADQRRADVIASFAQRLRTARAAAGNPSFREMAGRSKAISHTTLYDAAQGHRLPSWPTTVEFAKACGDDPEDYRAAWVAANHAMRASAPAPVQELVPVTASAVTTVEATQLRALADASPAARGDGEAQRRPLHRWRTAVGTLIVGGGAFAATAAIIAATSDDEQGGRPDGGGAAVPPLNSAQCPIRQANPPEAPPRHRGDRAILVDDVTLPDCAKVGTRETHEKVWRLKNVGTVEWRGYSLRRIDVPQRGDQCQTIVDIPVPDTQPGKEVDVRTQVTTPAEKVFCFVRFKMVDAEGEIAFPGNRPVNFQIIVD